MWHVVVFSVKLYRVVLCRWYYSHMWHVIVFSVKLYRVVLCRCCQQRGLEETGSCDSDQREDPSPSHLTYRFEITFHLPCAGIPHHIRRKHTAPSTEQLELEEKNTVQLLGNAASSLEARGSEHDDMEHFTFG